MRDALHFYADLLAFIDSGADADALLEGVASIDSPELYERGVEVCGSWDAALAGALVWLRQLDDRKRRGGDEEDAAEDVERPARTVLPKAHRSIFVVSRAGAVIEHELPRIAATPSAVFAPLADAPHARHRPELFVMGDDDSGMVLVTTQGKAVAVDARLLPDWTSDANVRAPSHQFGDIDPDEVFVCGLPRRTLRQSERFYSVSVFGQIKASDASEYARLSSDATPALLLKRGDALFQTFSGAKDTHIFVASSHGKAIRFPTGDIRSQGRRATGVRAVQLDSGARVVGAFECTNEQWVVLVTESGLAKRMSVAEFRPQARAGGGLQSVRLTGEDLVCAVGVADIEGDVILLTSEGRVCRMPAYDLPFGQRSSRGESIFSLDEGETVTQVLGVPAGHFAEGEGPVA